MAIKIMDPTLANKIAAGEVVERPRAIVKELVENALDAGASEIKVQLTQAGIQKITVTDNGSGMDAADAKLAFIRHATSKIFDEADLFAIHTLGFRGEALAAIAAVSKVRLVSGLINEPATELVLDGGVIVETNTTDSRIGTSIEVANLFFNTPARFKHLKSVQTEYTHILEYMQKMALGRPDIRFELSHDGKVVFKTYGTGELASTLVMIYGEKIADYLFPVQASNADFSVSGMISHPQMQRSHNRVMNLTINGRAIRHFGINHAILRGYGNLLPKGMFPIVALDVKLDVKLVDVNVHPAKLEVRISEEQTLQNLIEQMIKNALMEENLIYRDVGRPRTIRTSEQLGFEAEVTVAKEEKKATPIMPSERPKATQQLSQAEQTAAAVVYDIPEPQGSGYVLAEMNEEIKTSLQVEQETKQQEARVVSSTEATYPSNTRNRTEEQEALVSFATSRLELRTLDVIGQFDATYILAQHNQTLFVIDQHAAQERVRYDEHMRQVRANKRIVSQSLLFPLTVALEARDMLVLQEHEAELAQHGLDFVVVTDQTIEVRGVPAWIMQENIEAYVRKTIDCVVMYQHVDDAIIREQKLIMLSCRYSIKAHDVLSKDEMVRLLHDLGASDTPFTCPHGRPTLIKQSLHEVETWFKRV